LIEFESSLISKVNEFMQKEGIEFSKTKYKH